MCTQLLTTPTIQVVTLIPIVLFLINPNEIQIATVDKELHERPLETDADSSTLLAAMHFH